MYGIFRKKKFENFIAMLKFLYVPNLQLNFMYELFRLLDK